MTLLCIPNISEGRDKAQLARAEHAVTEAGARILDRHSDPVHNRTVYTLTGPRDALVEAACALAGVMKSIDLRDHVGAHPRLGGLDVCPFVPHRHDMADAIEAAGSAAKIIGTTHALPVFLYGEAARREDRRELRDLRRGGIEGLAGRVAEGSIPDEGPANIDPTTGAVCVGARDVLIAFNVWLRGDLSVAVDVAASVRRELGPSGVRALGLDMGAGLVQVSMNLTDPKRAGIDLAFEFIAGKVSAKHRIEATEIVGLVPDEFMADPDKEAARLQMGPGRSLESVLAG